MPAANEALDAAIAALTAQPLPWFLPVYSIRLTDPAMYQTFVDTYGFGTPVVIGLSPDAAVALTGVPLVSDPSFGAQQQRPEIYVHPSALNVLGMPITTAESGGTIAIGYTNALGHYDSVIWQWQCDVQLFPVPVPNPDASGEYSQQVVNWTGDGTMNRLIPTTDDLSVGVVAIWGCGGADASGLTQANFFRHNQSMPGTEIMGDASGPSLTTGIMAFQAGGFTVTVGVGSLPIANTLGVKYSAVVLHDTSGQYLSAGTYLGFAASGYSAFFHCHQDDVSSLTPIFDPSVSGVTMHLAVPAGDYVWTYVSALAATVFPPYRDTDPACAPTGLAIFDSVNIAAGARVVPNLPSADAAMTHLWVWGQNVTYKSDDVPGDFSMTLVSGAGFATPPTDTMVTALGVDEITVMPSAVGAAASANTSNKRYYFFALRATPTFLAQNLFASVVGVGPVSAPAVIPLTFTPELAFGRYADPVLNGVCVWRSSQHTGTDSTECSNPTGSGNDVPTDGIVALGALSMSFGTVIAPSGVPYYGWAFKGGSFSVGGGGGADGPPYNPVAVPPGDYSPNGGLINGGVGGLGVGHTGPCGCSLLE